MTNVTRNRQLDPAIRDVTDRLRRRIRIYAAVEGAGAALATLAAAFWATLLLDWLFEPMYAIRFVLLVGSLGYVGWLLATRCIRRATQRMPIGQMAMILERHFPQFDEALMTSVELIDGTSTADAAITGFGQAEPCNAAMLEQCHRHAAETARRIEPRQCFNAKPLRRMTLLSSCLMVSVVLFMLLFPDSFGLWARRMLLASNEMWPRDTRLEVEGFDENGVAKIARGDDFELIVRADTTMPIIPETVVIRGRVDGRRFSPINMNRWGTARPGQDPYQEYQHTFRSVSSSMDLDLYGGDAALRGLKIEVVDAPTLTETMLQCEYPAYMGRSPKQIDASAGAPIARGVDATLLARANKELVRVVIDDGRQLLEIDANGRRPMDRSVLAGMEFSAETAKGMPTFQEFTCPLSAILADVDLRIRLYDADGIESREPFLLHIESLDDDAPRVTARLRGIGSAITAEAFVPVEGSVTDDYGVAETWFEYTVDGKAGHDQPIAEPSDNVTDVPIGTIFDVRELGLSPDQVVTLAVGAKDRCDLDGEANVGRGDVWMLEIVTEQRLLSILEAREIVLRQRFEQLIDEVRLTRQSFDFMTFPEPVAEEDEAPTDNEADNEDSANEAASADEEEPTETEAERALAIRSLRLQRARRDTVKESYETGTVADAFLDIRDELVNNRIYTEERKNRIEDAIVVPLEKIADQMFPELERRLHDFETTIENNELGPANRDRAKQQLDAIIQQMEIIRDRMVEMETYNEAVELLRSIIDTQREIRERTQEEQKEKLRDLLGGGL